MTSRPAIDRYAIELFDELTHHTMSLRNFMESLAKVAGGATAAADLAWDRTVEVPKATVAVVRCEEAQ